MTARLVPVADPDNLAHQDVVLEGQSLTFGRGSGNNVVLDDVQVSKTHAALRRDDGHWVIQDLGSSNGTFVNGTRVLKHRLIQGDQLELGGCLYVFHADAGGPPTMFHIVPESREAKANVLATRSVQAFEPVARIDDDARLRGSYERLRAAFAAVRELITIQDVRGLCERMLEVTFELVRAETGVVLLMDEHDEPKAVATRSSHGDASQRVMVSRTVIDRVLKEREGVLANDALVDERFSMAMSIVRANMRSVMCVPLVDKGRLLGLLHVGNSSHASAFTNDDLDILAGLGAGASVAVGNALLTRRLEDESRARESLGRFLSPALVEQVLTQDLAIERGGAMAEVTVLFADIRGFTNLSERIPATEVVAMLNEYFDTMVEIVFRHGGVLDKFIGDALMAVWGTPVRGADDAARALAAAHEMHEALGSLNILRMERGEEPINIGVGLASGECVAGAMGARRRLDFTIIGDCVNLASRLAGAAGAGRIIIDEATFKRAGSPASATRLDPARVKGKAQPVQIFSLR